MAILTRGRTKGTALGRATNSLSSPPSTPAIKRNKSSNSESNDDTSFLGQSRGLNLSEESSEVNHSRAAPKSRKRKNSDIKDANNGKSLDPLGINSPGRKHQPPAKRSTRRAKAPSNGDASPDISSDQQRDIDIHKGQPEDSDLQYYSQQEISPPTQSKLAEDHEIPVEISLSAAPKTREKRAPSRGKNSIKAEGNELPHNMGLNEDFMGSKTPKRVIKGESVDGMLKSLYESRHAITLFANYDPLVSVVDIFVWITFS